MSAPALEIPTSPEAVAARFPLFGREADVRAILTTLANHDVRLVTLTGPGGIGKTRLAMQVAKEAATLFPDGITVVPLASVREVQRVPSAISVAVSARESGRETEVQAIEEVIGDRRMLLVLDNMEQVVDAAEYLAQLLSACRRLSLLVTSRMPLRLMREIEYPVTSLSSPAPGVSASLETVLSSPAVQLFAQRARSIRADFAVTPENAAAVAEICRRLDGLPLAIELAAARTKVLSPQALLTRLTHTLQVLTGGPRDAPARLQSMRDAIAWSYALLDEEQRRFFRSLGVFAGGFSLDAAEAVAGGEVDGRTAGGHSPSSLFAQMPVLDRIATLVDHSLVVPMQGADDEPRFGLLETIRDYAAEALEEMGELEVVRARHAHWLHQSSVAAAAQFFGPGETEAMNRIERESPNLRAALHWLCEHDIERAARLTFAVWYFWGVRGHYRDGLEWVHRLEPARAALQPETSAKVDLTGGFLHWALGDYERATAYFNTALVVFHDLGDPEHVAIARFGIGSVHRDIGALEIAEQELTEALTIFERLDRRAWMGFCLSLLGAVCRQQERYDDAITVLERGLAITRAIGFPGGMSPIVDHLGDIARERGDLNRALDYYRQTLPVWLEQRDPHGAADSLAGFAATLQGLGDLEGATRLLSAAAAVYEGLGFSRSRYGPAYKDEILNQLEKQLGSAQFQEIWEDGQSLSLQTALTLALDYQPRATTPAALKRTLPSVNVDRFGLTTREAEILEHLLVGRSNAEIGAILFISPRTAGTHIANIYGKLGVSSRSAAVAAVMRGAAKEPSK